MTATRANDAHARLGDLAARIEALPDRLLVYTDDGDSIAPVVHAHGIEMESAYTRRSTLEDVFLILTGRSLLES